jgi:hypothetical protein
MRASFAARPSTSHSASSILRPWPADAPVVASATGGIKEVVVDGETGYLVPFDQDPVTSFPTQSRKFALDLAARLNQMLEDPEKCRKFGEAGRRRVEEMCSAGRPSRIRRSISTIN